MPTPRVAYICSQELAQISSLLPSNRNRSALVHTLASSFGLLKNEICTVVRPQKAGRKELERYHEAGYLDYILQPHRDENNETHSETASGFGLEDDCAPFPRLDEYVLLIAGATLTAAQALQTGRFDVAICWDGGRHHAHRSHAAGFCYVADCVLCILQLKKSAPGRKGRPRVMYLDLDLHHGDGVAEAFTSRSVDEVEDELEPEGPEQEKLAPSNVLTLSIHHYSAGFYPHSTLGSLTTPWTSDPFSLSVPLARGTSAGTYARIWGTVERVAGAFFSWSTSGIEPASNQPAPSEPAADQPVSDEPAPTPVPAYLIVQCGVDGLAGDPYAMWNWDIDAEREGSMGWCVSRIMGWVKERGVKVVFLGGGGYDSPNAARAWTYLTSILAGSPLVVSADIPDHGAFLQYKPSFTLDVPAGNMPDENTESDLARIESSFNILVQRIQRAQT
ncbi:Arginase/deacetylase [Ceratobasidium sp. AG-I]|nr:Arginase/deacetylase [Ceratobasidium sp. AG-I]